MSGEPKHREPDDLSVPEKILRVQDLWDDIARSAPRWRRFDGRPRDMR